ncbi:MAG: acyl carrier protein [bacterium]|nr:acyl carrier protein [bacterium]
MREEDDVLTTIYRIVAEQMDSAVEDLPDITSLVPIEMDDLDRVEIANELEKALRIELPEDEHLGWRSLGNIHNSVRNALQMQEASVR